MKAIHLFLIFIIFLFSFFSCNDDLIIDKTDNCIEFDSNNIENKWTVELEKYYNYKSAKWIDMGDDILIISEGNIVEVFDKENGNLKSSMFIELSPTPGKIRNDTKIFTYNDIFVFKYFGEIYICNPYSKEIKKIADNADVNGELSTTGNKIVYASYQYENSLDNIIMIDIESLKFDTIIQKTRNSNENIDFNDPYLYVSSANDSLLYYNEEDGSSHSNALLIYDFKTGKSIKIQNSKIYTENIIKNNDDLYYKEESYFCKLNPEKLNITWKVEFDEHSVYHNPEIYFVNESIIISSQFNVISINKNTGKINWEEKYSFVDSQSYYSIDKFILSGDYLYLNYNNDYFRTLNINTGEFSEFYCYIPKAFNAFSMYSEGDNLYSISLAKELSKYTVK